MDLFVVISAHVHGFMPMGIYDSFAAAKAHVDELTSRGYHGAVCKTKLNVRDPSSGESLDNVFDNELLPDH